jgi:hypothetical protein
MTPKRSSPRPAKLKRPSSPYAEGEVVDSHFEEEPFSIQWQITFSRDCGPVSAICVQRNAARRAWRIPQQRRKTARHSVPPFRFRLGRHECLPGTQSTQIAAPAVHSTPLFYLSHPSSRRSQSLHGLLRPTIPQVVEKLLNCGLNALLQSPQAPCHFD